MNYTLSWDKSDDDNERDPFTFRYVDATRLDREWGYSDRDQRHRFNLWTLSRLPGDIFLNNRISYYSAQPTSASCTGQPTINPWGATSDRICADGSIIQRNTLRKDNAFFSWDARLSRPISHRATAIWKPLLKSSTCSTQTTSAIPPPRACSSTLTAPSNLASATRAKCKSACATFFDYWRRK